MSNSPQYILTDCDLKCICKAGELFEYQFNIQRKYTSAYKRQSRMGTYRESMEWEVTSENDFLNTDVRQDQIVCRPSEFYLESN